MTTVPLRHVAAVWTSSVDKHTVDGEVPVQLCNYTDAYKKDRVRPGADLMRATATPEEIQRNRLRVGDTVFTKDSEDPNDIGISAFVDGDSDDFVCGYHLAIARPADGTHSRFLNWVLRGRPALDHFSMHAVGISRYGISISDLRAAPVPVVDAGQQRRIADFLDDRVSRIDRIIAARQEQAALMEEILPNLIAEELEDRSADHPESVESGWKGCQLPAGWRASTLGRVLRQLTNGYVGPTRDILVDNGVRYIQSVHIKNGTIDFDRRPFFVSTEWHSARSRINLRPGDVLIVQTGAIGQVALVPEDFGDASCHALLIARADRSLISPEYLAAFLQSNFGQQAMAARATGALHPHLEGGVRSTPLLLPPRVVQDQVVDQVRKGQRAIRAEIHELLCSINLLSEYKSSLITAAVTGELDVTTAGSNIPE